MVSVGTLAAKTDRALMGAAIGHARGVCKEAFDIISSEDARKEGFFRRAGPLNERYAALGSVRAASEMTGEGVHFHDGRKGRGFPLPHSIEIYNATLSVRAAMYYSRDLGETLPERIDLDGLMAGAIGEEKIDGFGWQLVPISCRSGTYLEGSFCGFRRPFVTDYSINTFSDGPFDIDAGDLITGRLRFPGGMIHQTYSEILRFYPENNHEMARIALNLLSEFEAMLDSAFVHFSREQHV